MTAVEKSSKQVFLGNGDKIVHMKSKFNYILFKKKTKHKAVPVVPGSVVKIMTEVASC